MPRTKAEKFEYEYGSEHRVHWIKRLPCCACGAQRGCDNAHIRGASGGGGVGRKAHHRWVVPLCFDCHRVRIPSRGQRTLEAEARAAGRLKLFGVELASFDEAADVVDLMHIVVGLTARGIA